MKSLENIYLSDDNIWSADEFWKRYDRGAFTSDRKVAEYVLSVGGMVKVDNDGKEIKAVADLPRESFQLTLIDLNHNQRVTDAGLAAFRGCTNVRELRMHGCAQITDAGLAHFKAGRAHYSFASRKSV
jgi:hypothetical protein